MDHASRSREMYSQIFLWCLERIRNSEKTVLVGLNGPQGSGKTTLSKNLVEMLNSESISAVSLSIDDFYLTHEEQLELGERYKHNRFLQQRGYPGTHDLELGVATLKSLTSLEKGKETLIPSYDKSAHQGLGDRAPASQWRSVKGPLRAVIFEGWMLGFRPVREPRLENDLQEVDSLLEDYSSWNDKLDFLIMLDPADHHFAKKWRVEVEEKMAASGKPSMSREQIEKYISLFMPAYETYLPGLRQAMTSPWKNLKIKIGPDRLPE